MIGPYSSGRSGQHPAPSGFGNTARRRRYLHPDPYRNSRNMVGPFCKTQSDKP